MKSKELGSSTRTVLNAAVEGDIHTEAVEKRTSKSPTFVLAGKVAHGLCNKFCSPAPTDHKENHRK